MTYKPVFGEKRHNHAFTEFHGVVHALCFSTYPRKLSARPAFAMLRPVPADSEALLSSQAHLFPEVGFSSAVRIVTISNSHPLCGLLVPTTDSLPTPPAGSCDCP